MENKHPEEGAQEFVCPVCNSDRVDNEPAYISSFGVIVKCSCNECGATFKQVYDIQFAGHYEIEVNNND